MAIKEVGQSADSIIGIEVSQTAPTNTQVLAYNSTSKKWESTTPSSGGASLAFKTIAVSGQTDVVADSATDTLTLVAGSNVTITTSGDEITFVAADTNTQLTQEQVEDFVNGVIVGGTNITATYDDAAGTLTLVGADTNTQLTQEQVEDFVNGVCVGGTNVTITYDDAAGTLTFVSADTNTQLTQEQVEDYVDGVIVGGTNVTATYDDAAGTLTLSSTDTNTQTESFKTISVSGQDDVVADSSTDTLTLAAGSNITITTTAGSDTITIAATDTDTTGGWTDGSNVIYPTTLTDALGLGTNSPDTALEIAKEDADAVATISCYHDTEATAAKLVFRKADGSESSPALVDDDAVLGKISFQGNDGNSWEEGARVEARVQGTASDPTDMPTELSFWTSPNGSSTCTERMTIINDGSIMMGATSSTTPIHLLELKASDTSDSTTIAAAVTDGLALNMGGGVATDEYAPAVSWFSIDGNLNSSEKTIAAITAQAAEDFDSGDDSGADLVFLTHKVATSSGLTEKARITAGGNLGVGQDTPLVAVDVLHDPTGLVGDTGGGESVLFGSGSTVAGKLYFLHTDGAWVLSQGDAVATGASQLLAIALGTTPGTHGMLVRGFFDVASHLTGTFVKGTAVYVSETTAGTIDVAAPAASGDFVRVVGHATDLANVIYFNPSGDWIEL